MKLVIVESPTKAKTIEKFLGKDFIVTSSFGHIRDLPVKGFGVDIENDFTPKYQVPSKARERVKELKAQVKKAEETILATDEDREGEAISWHLLEVLKPKKYERITFHEITKPAIEEALKHPRDLDIALVDAQQARRILDRLVGYKLSPFLWTKIFKGLSAGRVQSVALRLVVDKEREIEKFVPQEYWTMDATLTKVSGGKDFLAHLFAKDGKALGKFEIGSKEDAEKCKQALAQASWSVAHIEQKDEKRNPLPPFRTSTLQQEASHKLGFSSKRTMLFAQNLYEKGLITYHRTDSLNIAQSALEQAHDFIIKQYGENFWAGKARVFKTTQKNAQEAHEAIRPSYPERMPDMIEGLEPAQKKLYTLIWQRFIASQMAPAIFAMTSVDIATQTPYTFRANGSVQKFEGYLRVYPMKVQENELPALQEKDALNLEKLDPTQHFTEPPARYNEATLIKALEQYSIGRPSTYAPILSTIQERNYVIKDEQKRFRPTEIGITVTDLLVEHFPQVVDVSFTAHVEEELDGIADGDKKWQNVLHEFYDPFAKLLAEKYTEVKKLHEVEETDKACPECGKPLLIRTGRFGRFYACSGFPECKHTEALEKTPEEIAESIPCPTCKEGTVVSKRTKKGKVFYGCSRYPDCTFALWYKPHTIKEGESITVEKCPDCGNALVEFRGQILCSDKKGCGYKRKIEKTEE